jgi:two-component system, NtrC family, nitrogen regulation sensor histidine kinase NtrY
MAGLPRLSHERRILALAVLVALPGAGVALWLLGNGDQGPLTRWTLSGAVILLSGLAVRALHHAVTRPLGTLGNVLAALREGDFSMRFHASGHPDDPLDHVAQEVNALSSTLRAQRLGAAEAAALLNRVIEEIDVAVLSIDSEDRLQLVNRAAERLLGRGRDQLLSRPAVEAGVADLLTGEAPRLIEAAFPGEAGRFEVRRTSFRQEGLPQRLLVVSNLSRALREEERQAWQRLIRVLGHELNNSLAPIQSIAGSLEALLAQQPPPGDRDDDMRRGLAVIRSRAESLGRFMEAYGRLARLPAPRPHDVVLRPLAERVARLETRVRVAVDGPELTASADADQIEQVLINLVRNAADAAAETGGGVRLGWSRSKSDSRWLDIWVDDDGPGLAATTNLFVPFFTTKPQGSGIGLVLSRQIAEAHGGSLTLQNRTGARGCRARLRLPAG